MPHMVVQLGLVRDEEERGVFIQAYERLGDPAAEAIADALTDTEDRSARKSICDGARGLRHSRSTCGREDVGGLPLVRRP